MNLDRWLTNDVRVRRLKMTNKTARLLLNKPAWSRFACASIAVPTSRKGTAAPLWCATMIG